MADEMLDIIHTFDPGFELNYTKFYIGLAKNGRASNFALFRPRKHAIKVEVRLEQSDEISQELEEAGLEFDHNPRGPWYRIELPEGPVDPYSELLLELFQQAHDYYYR